MGTQLIWRAATRFHDWERKDKNFIYNMCHILDENQLIGNFEWFSMGPKDVKISALNSNMSLKELLNYNPKRNNVFRIGAGGESPSRWELTLGLFPFQSSIGRVEGFNIINIYFNANTLLNPSASDDLVKIFRLIHTPDNTEFAFIHPYQRYDELANPLFGQYHNPLTIGTMFTGITWCTFLGKEHLKLFQISNLQHIKAYEVNWTGQDGLFIRISQNVEDTLTAETEKEMFKLTEEFRNALI